MSGNRLKVEDVKVFSDAALGFFAQTTGHKASVRTAYLLDGAGPMVWNDFQGRIELAGRYRGSVTFSAPRGLLTHVLLSIGDGRALRFDPAYALFGAAADATPDSLDALAQRPADGQRSAPGLRAMAGPGGPPTRLAARDRSPGVGRCVFSPLLSSGR